MERILHSQKNHPTFLANPNPQKLKKRGNFNWFCKKFPLKNGIFSFLSQPGFCNSRRNEKFQRQINKRNEEFSWKILNKNWEKVWKRLFSPSGKWILFFLGQEKAWAGKKFPKNSIIPEIFLDLGFQRGKEGLEPAERIFNSKKWEFLIQRDGNFQSRGAGIFNSKGENKKGNF